MALRDRPNYRQVVEHIRRQAPQPLTPLELETIEHRQVQIIQAVREVLTESYFQAIAEPGNIATKGGIAYQRQLTFAKVAIFNEGRNLLLHWSTIKSELLIPWSVHYYNNALSAWKAVGSNLESSFYTTKTDDFDPTEIGLYDGRWLPVQANIPGFGIVERDDALEFLGLVGGVDPVTAHPERTFRVRNTHTTIAPEQDVELRLATTVHAEFPVTYVVTDLDPLPAWMTMTADGLLSLAPPVMADEVFTREVTATDGLGIEVVFTLTVSVVTTV